MRAQQTAEALGLPVKTDKTLAPGASPAAILKASGWPDYKTAAVIVCHQPDLGRVGGEVLGTPGASSAWLANKLAEFDRALLAGMRVMSGSFTRQYGLAAGDRVDSRFAPLGAVRAEFR